MPYTSISLIPNQFQHIIKNSTSTLIIHSLDFFSNPNLIHLFLNLYQNHHDSTLNTTILPSIQENQSIRYRKHQNPTFPPLETYLFLVFLGSFLLIPLVDHLKSLKKEKNNHTSPCSPWPRFSSPPFLSFLFSFCFSLFLMGMDELSSFEQTFIFLNLYFDPHNLPNYT